MPPSRRYEIDPDDPRAPAQADWDALGEQERRSVVRQLPGEFSSGAALPRYDAEHDVARSVREALRGHFRRHFRRVFIAGNLPIYYPGARMFSVDALAVLDVARSARHSWIVSAEQRGIDLAFDVAWPERKDCEHNVGWFAGLGISEYFVFDPQHSKLRGFRLPDPDAVRYQPILPQAGRYASSVLGLELAVEDGRLCVYAESGLLPDSDAMIERLDEALLEVRGRAEIEARLAEEAARIAEEASRRADGAAARAQDAERRLAQALSELERLKSRG